MSCNEPCKSMLEQLQDDVRDALSDLSESGELLYGFYKVFLVNNVYGEDFGFLGEAPEIIDVNKTQITPAPRVEVNTKMYVNNEIIVKAGKARVTQIIASDNCDKKYTREDLEGADYWLIDGSPYTLIEGGLKRLSNGIFWEAILERKQINGMTRT